MCPLCSFFSDLISNKLRAKAEFQTAHTKESYLLAVEVHKRDIKGITYIQFMLKNFKWLEFIVSCLKTCPDECWTKMMAYAQELFSYGPHFSFLMSI